MKKLIIACMVLIGGMSFAQEVDAAQDIEIETGTVWEFKANAFYLVLGIAEASVEHSLNNHSAIGITGSLPFDDEVKESIEYLVTPYYRHYFGNGHAEGFYLEGFGMLNSIERDVFDLDFEEDGYTTDFALGIGLGGKWVTNGNFVGELNLGVGRNLFNNEEHDYRVILKAAISVGYRF